MTTPEPTEYGEPIPRGRSGQCVAWPGFGDTGNCGSWAIWSVLGPTGVTSRFESGVNSSRTISSARLRAPRSTSSRNASLVFERRRVELDLVGGSDDARGDREAWHDTASATMITAR